VTEPLIASNSSIQAYKRCKRKWWLTYYRGLKPVIIRFTGPLALGSRVHLALEQKYGYGKDLLDSHAKLVAQDRALMLMDSFDTGELDADAELGRIMLEGYEQWVAEEGMDAYLQVISAEEKLELPMMEGRVNLIGKLDIRFRRLTDGVRLFGDFKTSANFRDLTSIAHMDEQQLLYHVLETKQPEEVRCDGGMYRLLKKVKRGPSARPPFYEQMEVRHNIFMLRSFWARLHGMLTDMLATKDALDDGADPMVVAYPTPNRNCAWDCNFFAICPMFDDGSAAESAVEMAYTTGDPFAYYEVQGPLPD
jgi:PD-(D/E)XK nuclease superfamily